MYHEWQEQGNKKSGTRNQVNMFFGRYTLQAWVWSSLTAVMVKGIQAQAISALYNHLN